MGALPHRVTIVILTFNGLPYTRRCLETLFQNTGDEARVVVVDNASTDGTIEYLQAESRITLIRNPSNLGFARANNIAIRDAPPDHDIVLLNNDTEIHQPGWLARLQQTAYDSVQTGVVGCRLVSTGGMLIHAGAILPLETFWGQQIGSGERDINQYNQDREVESVVFACVYLKRELLDKAGLLDEDYFCYFEDTDYCMRAAARGYRTVCCGRVTIVHHEGVSTSVNGLSHSRLFREGQRVFRSKWEESFTRQRYTREAAWHSTLNLPTGYAISSRELATALDRSGVRLSYRYVYGPGTSFALPEPEQSDSTVVNQIRSRKLRRDVVQVVYGQGDVFNANSGPYKIGFTMLETDRIPKEWVRQANRMDEVWVPSQFNAETFRESGVTRPIHVVPLGFDPGHFNPGIERRPVGDVYTFLSIFEWGERKAPEILLRAFNQEFRANERVILIAKVINQDAGVDVARAVGRLSLDPAGGRIHLSLNQLTPLYQLGVLYRSADCFVLPTRGEGWGLPILEAMACGLPVIATDWSAQRDFMNAGNAYPLRVEKLVNAEAKCPHYRGFRWAEPSFTELRRLMRHVFENQQEARAMGECAAREVRQKWTWDHSAAKIIARLDCIG